MNTRDEIWIFI